MTLFRLLTEGTRALEQAGAPDAKQDAQQLLLAAFQLDMVHFLMNRMQELEENDWNQRAAELYREMIGRRRRRCPLQQILGSQEFMGLEFYVNSHVLIPRQDTETLVEQVLADMAAGESRRNPQGGSLAEEKGPQECSLLDLCTGSGCIAVSLAVKGEFSRVTATDISGEALKVAQRNAQKQLPEWEILWEEDRKPQEEKEEAPGREKTGKGIMELYLGDLFDALPEDGRKYDVITANPPYIPTKVISTLEPEVRDHEPVLALDGAEDGLNYYRRIGADAGRYLKPGGRIYLEIGYDQGTAVSRLLREVGYENIRVYRDLPGRERVVAARWPA